MSYFSDPKMIVTCLSHYRDVPILLAWTERLIFFWILWIFIIYVYKYMLNLNFLLVYKAKS